MKRVVCVILLLAGSTGITHIGLAQQGHTYTPSPSAGAYAPLVSPTLTGIPTAPTATLSTNSNQLATTAFVQSLISNSGGGSVTNASVITANGFSGSVANPTSTPAFTIGTTIIGLLKGNGSAVSAAIPGTDYLTSANVGTAAGVNTGISGAVVGLLNGNNTYSGTSTFGPIITNDVNGYQLGGPTITLNTYANTTSPITTQGAANTALPTSLYFNQPLSIGYAETLTGGTSVNQYASLNGVNLTMNATVTSHWGEQETGINLLCGTAPCTMSGELNNIKRFVNVPFGFTLGGGENYEGGFSNSGTVQGWKTLLSAPQNTATGTVSDYYVSVESYLNNANPTLHAVFGYEGLHCNTMVGGGSPPQYNFCIRNDDPTAAIVTLGNVRIGSAAIPTASTMLEITGADSTAGLALQVQNSANANLFYVNDSGTTYIPLGQLRLGNSGQIAGSLAIFNATSGGGTITLNPPSGIMGVVNLTWPITSGTLAVASTTLAGYGITSPLPAAQGGSGLSGATAANGTLLIGNGTGYSLATLTAGANITIDNTAGAIAISAALPAGGGIVGPLSSTANYLPQWNSTDGTLLSNGLPVGLTGNNTVVETTSSGLLTPTVLPAATNSTIGGVIVGSGLSVASGTLSVAGGTVNIYTTTGTYNVTGGYQFGRFIVIGGGGCGGSGAMENLGTVGSGGAGAAPGDIKDTGWLPIANIGTAFNVIIDATCTPGATTTVVGPGNIGTVGGKALVQPNGFIGYPNIYAFGGGGGGPGQTAAVSVGGSSPSDINTGVSASVATVNGSISGFSGIAGGSGAAGAAVASNVFANPSGAGASVTAASNGTSAGFKHGSCGSGGTLLAASATIGGSGATSHWSSLAATAGAIGGGNGNNAINTNDYSLGGTGASGGGSNTTGAGGYGGSAPVNGYGQCGAGGGAGTTAGGAGGQGGSPAVILELR